MMTRSDFRHDSTIRLVRGDLGRHLAGEQLSITQNSYRRFITGCFDSENGHDPIVGKALRLPNPTSFAYKSRARLLLDRIALGR